MITACVLLPLLTEQLQFVVSEVGEVEESQPQQEESKDWNRAMSGSGTLFHADHPRRLIPELSANAHNAGWFVGIGSGGFFSIKQG